MAAFPNPINLFVSWIVHNWAAFRGFETLARPEAQIIRQKECDVCVYVSEGGWLCNLCGCMLIAKRSLAMEQCPIGKWKRIWKKKNLR